MIDDYFSTGNVYVIDDQINEATPIINSLYSHQIPHIYLDGGTKGLPKEKRQVRLIFLDLNLKPTLNPKDKKSFKNIHAGILNKLLANNSSSYLILVWSKQEDTFLEDFKEIFNEPENQFNLNQRPPLEIISLEKKDFFETADIEGTITHNWREGKEDDLIKLIEEKLVQNEAFKILSAWETLISKSGSRTVDYLFDLVQGEAHTAKNAKLDSIITSLSISYLGFENFINLDNQKRTDAFMLALSELIDDEIDKEIIINSQPEFENWLPKKRLKPKDKGRLNSKLLTSIDVENRQLTGSIYKVINSTHNYEKLFFDAIDLSRSLSKKQIKIKEDAKGTNLDNAELTELKSEITNSILKDSTKFIPIELNLTPLCDVAQNKEEYYRLVPGFLIDTKSREYLFDKTDRNYFSPLLFSEDGLNECYLILDYRYFHSTTKTEVNKMIKFCCLRKSFVDEIQAKLANHVSRFGLLYLP
ncbi:hypothetical protein [uncultured Aquimarina sp.]|uniref:hypothetical protein n=1 Tax=uncultured Aquimarina sp. TaxID=575652 RepID=UPI0026280BFD|nr:hypothetical protein [uncultured Aquimarina sp.]